MRFLLFALALALVSSCNRPQPSISRLPARAEEEASVRWILNSNSPSNEVPAYLTNSIYGVRIGPFGTAEDAAGHSLPLIKAGAIDHSKDEKLIEQPNPFSLGFEIDGAPPRSVDEYRQTMNLKNGLLTTSFSAASKSGVARFHADFQAIAPTESRPGKLVGIYKLTVPIGATVSWRQAKFPGVLWRFASTDSTHHPKDSRPDRVSVVSNGQPMEIRVTLVSPALKAAPKQVGRRVVLSNLAPSIEIDGPPEDQSFIDSAMFYLQEGVPLQPPYQMGPMGLSSNLYNGHEFWDADIWLMPALALIKPEVMTAVVAYRLSKMQPPPGPPFVWESSASGKETAPGAFNREIHISGSVLFGMHFASALGVPFPSQVRQRVADFYKSQMTPRGPKDPFNIDDVISPDENHRGNNDLYTNLLADWSIGNMSWNRQNPGSQTNAHSIYLPSDSKSYLSYENDPIKSYKQASAVLSIYPLQFPPAEAQAVAMLHRFAPKVIQNGPAMSDAIHSIIATRFGDVEEGYRYWHDAWQPFTKNPFLLFSEKRNRDRTYFTTGAAGALQSVIYGFLGFRLEQDPNFLTRREKAAQSWKKKVDNGMWLTISPHLPHGWKSATFKNFRLLGKIYTLKVRRQGSTVKTSVTGGK